MSLFFNYEKWDSQYFEIFKLQGPVVQKPINANPTEIKN